jgi:DNA end-binding protein Ku
MATTVWKGYISFGLISIPVMLKSAARAERVSLNRVHQCESGAVTKVNQLHFCPTCDIHVSGDELSTGFEMSKDSYALIDKAEVEALKEGRTTSMEIDEFVKLSEVDPIFFDKSYYVVPTDGGEKPYELLYQAMANKGLAARSILVMRKGGTEYNVFIRVLGPGLTVHTVFAHDEVREVPEYNTPRSEVVVKEKELEMAKSLLESMVVPFDSTTLKNNYTERVEALLESKRKAASAPVPTQGPDLMDTMRAMLDAFETRKAAA